ncbi:MAG: hypothetical protein KF815_08220 [Rhodospirillales bacterium]|jgi:hypothetical protein|uniref:Surface antigen domain-containing protein n=2 Tax=root TaxID=1 RepID=A0A564WJS7_9PROT|nr:hypothetical protein [Rhodospirillales bacterium]MDG4576196.1 hypothetical protein [Defluviicoccus sp.]SUS06592.1 exported hypothetical protein [uncultured Defluviicoccus sp.]VUX47894.1 exported hypothetical protein [Candidatus Defluviicoccus seviourii]MDG4592508.1 hypothetical protein [Defluviicoccus sp.]
MKTTMLFAAVLAVSGFALSAQAQDNKCQKAVADALSNYGVKWTDLKNVQWDVDTWNTSSRGGGTSISGYQMYAEPASCASGDIIVEMDEGCGINDIATRGGCQIKGLPNRWW